MSVWQSIPIVITIYRMLLLPSQYLFIWWLVVAGAGTLDLGSLRLITASWHEGNHQGPHVAIKPAPILSHLFGAEFGLEILLETGRLSSQLFSDWSVLCCSRTKLGSNNCHTIFGAEFGAAAPLLSQRAHTAHAFESQKPPL